MEMLSGGFLGVMLLLGGQVGLPLGLPPLPDDPVLSHTAPEECLLYFSWSGVAEPDAKSTNQTEQMLAEPEVKQFIETVGKALGAAIKKGAPATPQGQVLGQHGPKLIHALLTHRTALFISKVEKGQRGPQVFGGVIISTGDQTEEIEASLEKIEKVLALAPSIGSAPERWHRLLISPDSLHIEWAVQGKYLIVGIGPGSGDSIVRRMNGETPAWLSTLKQKLRVERVSTVFYLNVKKGLELAGPLVGEPEMRQILEALGVANIRTIASSSGLEGTGCLSKIWIETAGDPSGVFTMFGPEPLKAADLATIPKDASFAAVARVHPSKLYDAVFEGIKKISPDAATSRAAELAQTEAMLGFRLKRDLFDVLGDTWCVYNSPGEGGLLLTGLTIVAPVKDRDRLAKTNDRLIELARPSAAAGGPAIKETKFRGQRIFFVNSVGNEFMPFAPAWCVSDTHLILSLSPQNVRAFLSRDAAAGSLADLPAVAERLKAGDAVLLTYQDTAGMMKITYPVLQIFLTLGFSEMQREGIDLDPSVLPSLASIIRHVEPGVGMLVREKNGLVYVSRQSLPVNVGLPVLIGATTLFGFAMQPVPFAPAQPPILQEPGKLQIEVVPEEKPKDIPVQELREPTAPLPK
jgi:hypothetical protein